MESTKTETIYSKWGEITIQKDFENLTFRVTPCGFISPDLIKETLRQATSFACELKGRPWTYQVNIDQVKMIHPFNFYYLLKIKKIPHLKQYKIQTQSRFKQAIINLLG